jgi:hypothetical protein
MSIQDSDTDYWDTNTDYRGLSGTNYFWPEYLLREETINVPGTTGTQNLAWYIIHHHPKSYKFL